MSKFYFDISNLVEHAKDHPQVTGIERVQTKIISRLSRFGLSEFSCIYWSEVDNCFLESSPDKLFPAAGFSTTDLLFHLGFIASKWIPPRRHINYVLRQQGKKRLGRHLTKLYIFILAWFRPCKLADIGLRRPTRQIEKVRIRHLPILDPSVAYVALGYNWRNPKALEQIKRYTESGGHVIQMVHDVIPIRFPDYFSPGYAEDFARGFSQLSAHAYQFLCVSESTKSDLLQYLSPSSASCRTDVVPLAHEFDPWPRNSRGSTLPSSHVLELSNRRFVLCVGTIEIRKNGARLLRAWREVLNQLGSDAPTLIFAGKLGWKIDEFLDELGGFSRQHVIHVQNINDTDVAYLFQTCLFTVFPSLYEGWGLPAAESLWFGKHCIASSTSSLPEVGKDSFDYIDPLDCSEITKKILHTIRDKDYLAHREHAIRTTQLRTWDCVAREFVVALMSSISPSSASRN